MTDRHLPTDEVTLNVANDRVRSRRLAVIAFAVGYPTLLTWLYFVALKSTAPAIQQAAYTVGKAIQFGLPVVWVYLSRREDFRPNRRWHSGAVIGLLFGVVVAFAMWGLYSAVLQPSGFFDAAAVQVRSKVSGLGLNSPGKYAALAVFYALCHSLLEEYYWRWFVFRELRLVTGLSKAIAISSVGFAAHHVLILATFFGWSSPATWLFAAAVGVGGAIWASLYDRYQSLVGPWLGHCLVDAAIFWIGFDLLRESFG